MEAQPRKIIKLDKNTHITMGQFKKISRDLKKKNLKVTKENVLEQHYKVQTLHPLKRILMGAVGALLSGAGLYNYTDIWLLLLLLIPGVYLLLKSVKGRKKEINQLLEISEFAVEGIFSAGEVIFELLTSLED